MADGCANITVRYSPAEGRCELVNVKVRVSAGSSATIGNFLDCIVQSGDAQLAETAKQKRLVLVHRGVTLEEGQTLKTYQISDGSTVYAFGKPVVRSSAGIQQDGNLVLRELVILFNSLFSQPAFHAELDAAVNTPSVIETALRAAFPDRTPAERDVFAEPILRNVRLYYVILALRNSPNVLRTLATQRVWLLRGLIAVGKAVHERLAQRSRDEPVGGAPFGFGAADLEEANEQQQQRVAAAQRPGSTGSRIRRHQQFFRPYGAEPSGATPREAATANTAGPISSDFFAAALSRAQQIGGLLNAGNSPQRPSASTAIPPVTTPTPAPAPAPALPSPSISLRNARLVPANPRQAISTDSLSSAMQQAQRVISNAARNANVPTSSQQSAAPPPSATPPVVSDRERYATQLKTLADMGISDDAALEALKACDGDVDAVVQFLFGGN